MSSLIPFPLDRRDGLCKKFMTEVAESREHPLAFLVLLPMSEPVLYNLISGATQPTKLTEKNVEKPGLLYYQIPCIIRIEHY